MVLRCKSGECGAVDTDISGGEEQQAKDGEEEEMEKEK